VDVQYPIHSIAVSVIMTSIGLITSNSRVGFFILKEIMPNPGLSPELLEAQRRRSQGNPSPALNQMSPGAANASSLPQPATPSSLTQASAPGGEAPAMPKFEPQNRKDLIVMSLIEQLKNDNKLDKEKMKMATQPMPEPAQASVAPPSQPTQTQAPQTPSMGGGGFSLSPGIQQPMARNQMQGDYGSGMGKDYSGLNNYRR